MTNIGLTSLEAARLLREFGPNSVESDTSRSKHSVALAVLREPMLLLRDEIENQGNPLLRGTKSKSNLGLLRQEIITK